ncbi:MAG: acyl carrier protein [Sulfitobacter sp.]
MTINSQEKLVKDLCELAATLAWVDPESVTPTTSLSEIGVDSLGSIELVAQVEAHLGVMLPEKDIPHLDTVNEIVEYAASEQKKLSEVAAG